MILTKDGVNRYFLHDIDSGYPYEVSKEYYEKYNKMILEVFEMFKPKIDSKYKSIPIIYGTGGDFDNKNSNFAEIFFNPEKYSITPFDNTWKAELDTKLINYFKPTYMGREFVKPEPLKDEDLMPSGKHKGTKMIDVPAKYLVYIFENDMCSERVKEYIIANLDVIRQQAKSEQ